MIFNLNLFVDELIQFNHIVLSMNIIGNNETITYNVGDHDKYNFKTDTFTLKTVVTYKDGIIHGRNSYKMYNRNNLIILSGSYIEGVKDFENTYHYDYDYSKMTVTVIRVSDNSIVSIEPITDQYYLAP